MRIAFSLPIFKPADTSDSSFLHQMMLMEGLKRRGNTLSMIAPASLSDVVFTRNLSEPDLVRRTWSEAGWFKLASKAAWRLQRGLGVPYLNFFSNACLYDAALRCLPGQDLVHERNGLYKMGVAMACRRLRIPYLLFFDADDILEHDLFGKPLQGALRWRARQAIRYNLSAASRVICVSEAAKRHLIAAWQVPEDKIAVFVNGVNIERFRPDLEGRAAVRLKLGMDEDPLVIFVGSFFPYQDVHILLDAFARVRDQIPRARLLLVGEGEQYEQEMAYARELGLAESVHFTGFLPQADIPPLINAADVAVAPYTRLKDEQFLGSSLKIFEYMACGAAVIASDMGQIREVICNEGNGLLVPAGDCEGLASAMLRLLGDRQLCLQLGKQARRDAVQNYSWERYIRRLEEVYAAVLQ